VFTSSLLLSAIALCPAAQSARPEPGALSRNGVSLPIAPAFERELRVREAAADPSAASQWLDASLDGSAPGFSWTQTADALDALARALDARPELDIDRWRPALQALTGHAHPNLRAGAWRVLARSPKGAVRAALPAGSVVTWEERMERARTIARSGADSAELESLADDSDSRVAEVALAEWMQASGRDDQRVAQSWMRAFDRAGSGADEREVRLFELLELAPHGLALAERVEGLAAAHDKSNAAASRRLEALSLASLARQAGSLDSADLDRLAASWDAVSRSSPGARALLVRAARTLGPALGERLLAEACSHAEEVDIASSCLAGAVESLDAAHLLESVAPRLREQPALAELLLDSLRGRVDSWEPQALVAWLAPGMAPSQRAHTLLVVAETFRQNADPGSATILERALDDSDPAIASEAFQGLAGAPDPTPWMESLHRCYARHSPAWQRERLADLSREIAWKPFRADLLELASRSRTASARVAELLAPFQGDLEVADALREWLEQDLSRLRESPRGGLESEESSELISSVLSLVRALNLVAGERATASLEEALVSSRGRSLELGKTTIYQLGRSELGRRGLVRWLSHETPSRLRAEAALALAPHPGREAAIRVLLEDYAHYDEDLRSRALRAFAMADDETSAQKLASVARAQASGAAEMITAVECLCARARRAKPIVEQLFAWLDDGALDSELRTLIIVELARAGDESVLARLAQRLAGIESFRDSGEPKSPRAEERALERETLITALAVADSVAAIEARTAFVSPLERAASDLAARSSGQHRAEVEFTSRAELGLVAALARAGRLEHALDTVAGWRGLDARFLLESAARADGAAAKSAGGLSAGEQLALAAAVGLGGEVEVDDTSRARFEARRRALEGARERGDHAAFAARGAATLHDLRAGTISTRIFARAFGDFDPGHGVDGLAKLECDVHLARARVALGLGDRATAARELGLARAARGASKAAMDAVASFERELEPSGR